MLCYHPITIVNPTKYVSLKYRDRFTLRVPCGMCAACQENKRREYYLRSYYHANECLSNGGFVLFDTLTYRNKDLPHISDFVTTKFNYPCFNSRHIRNFIANLRQRCKRWYGSNFDYMLSSEYGTSDHHTHRPHYHVLFFVTGQITPLQFSRLVAETWTYGRTDGKPYKSDYYVLGNVLDNSAKKIRVLKYVTKYISKSCMFTKQIIKRVNSIMFEIASRPEYASVDWLSTLAASLYREKIMRYIGQFHRQSTGFGASLLCDLDINQLFSDGNLRVVDNQKVLLTVPLPMYYKRKLFYDRYDVDGSIVWTPSDLGLKYLEAQRNKLYMKLKDYYTAALLQSKLTCDVNALTEYVIDKRGRIKADCPESTLIQRITNVDLFKYSTRYDRANFGKLGIVKQYLGNSTTGYYTLVLPASISLIQFGKKYVYYDDDFEAILDKIDDTYVDIGKKKQSAYELRQRLTNLYHSLRL